MPITIESVFFNCRYTEKKAKSKKKKKNKHGKDESSKIKSSSSKDKVPAIGSSLEKTKNAAFDRLRDDAASSSGIEQALITFTKSMRVAKFWLDKFTTNKLLYRFVKFLGKCLSQTAVHKTKFWKVLFSVKAKVV